MTFPTDYEKCTGCGVCAFVCPHNAIDMVEDNEGFCYPNIDGMCVDCGICTKLCPQNRQINEFKANKAECYAAYSQNKSIRYQSSSGGIANEISQYVLGLDGVVCGAVYDEKLCVKHIVIDNLENLTKLNGSKYMQSSLDNAYYVIKKNLYSGKEVLFFGTPCQVHAIQVMFSKWKKNLITVDLLCYGIPSSKSAHEFIREIESNYNKRVVDVTLKDKTFGWHKPKSRYTFEDGSDLLIKEDSEDYLAIACFVDMVCVRKSCFNCKYKTIHRISDISIGDFWGIDNLEMDNDNGTNAVIVNTDTGMRVFQDLIAKQKVKVKPAHLDEIVKGNPHVFHNDLIADKEKRTLFWKILENDSFSKAVKKLQER